MILVANLNSNTCRLYCYKKHPFELALINEISHPENKLKNSELTSDGPGHYQTDKSVRGTYSPNMLPKDVEIDNFAREVARELNQKRNEGGFQKFVVIAPAHMSGLIAGHLNKYVKEMLLETIHKDLMHLSHKELQEFVHSHVQFPVV